MHDINLKNRYGRSLEYYFKRGNIPIPYHWHQNDMDIFDKACYGEIP